MYTIKFGTDGWRAIIAEHFTTQNVARVAEATALWALKRTQNPTIVLGYDCRFAGKLFAETIIKVLYSKKIKVIFYDNYCTTPMLSLAAKEMNATIGIMITASHNPSSYNGFKLKSNFGGPSLPVDIEEIENYIPSTAEIPSEKSIENIFDEGFLVYDDFLNLYLEWVKSNINLKAINNSSLKIGYNAMFGAGQMVVPKLLEKAIFFNCQVNPNFNNTPPEPIPGNLIDFSTFIKKTNDIDISFVNDGDADRIALMDKKGNYIDAHMILLMLIYILGKEKKMTGKVVVAFSVSPKIYKLCEILGLEYEVTKIGFKYIAEIIQKENVLVGGEESGGISVSGHIPERDGIWDALIILEYLATTNKTLEDLISEINKLVGQFAYGRNDLHLNMSQKESILNFLNNNSIDSLANIKVEKTETIDGFKYHLSDERVLMIRASGTEPVLRVYCQAENDLKVKEILEKTCSFILEI